MRIDIKKPIDKALKTLTKQQRNIVSMRYGLSGKKRLTLQDIADDYDLTRERIRQIQSNTLDKLRHNDCISHLSSVIMQIEETMHACGGVSDKESLCVLCNLTTKSEQSYLRLLLDLADNFSFSKGDDHMKAHWHISRKDGKKVSRVLSKVHKKFESMEDTVIDDSALEKIFREMAGAHKDRLHHAHVAGLSRRIKANKFGEWGLNNHPEISLLGLSGYIRIVLRHANKPLHFSEIAERVSEMQGKECNTASCHNELVRNESFVLIGRGIYTMRSAGHTPGTIYDVITEGIKKNGPMTKDEIIAYVLERRVVQPNSVVLTLYQKPNFVKNNNKYSLKTV